MKNRTLGILILLLAVVRVSADTGTIEFDSKTKKIFLNQSFRIVNQKGKIPSSYWPAPKFANPNEPFEKTDIVTNPSWPFARLIFAGFSKDYFFIYYEQGGRGYSCQLRFYKILSGQKKLIGVFDTRKKLTTIEAVKKVLSK
jgi:hypothetical protein